MKPVPELSRRHWLKRTSLGVGWLALANLLHGNAPASLQARAKRVIFISLRGGPSQLDTFSYKPELTQRSGQAGNRPGTKLLGSPWSFQHHGQSGQWMSELFPNLAKHVDDLCLIHSMQTDFPAHAQAFLQMHTGSAQMVRPSLGAWTLYGLGSENSNLPGFVTLSPPSDMGGAQNYGSGFLPAAFQATRLGAGQRPIASAAIRNLQPFEAFPQQRRTLDFIQSLNRETLKQDPLHHELEGVIASYEMAFKMQMEMPELLDLSHESEATRTLYGLGVGKARGLSSSRFDSSPDDFGRKCLIARKLSEAGVRFVEVSGGNWDQHFLLKEGHAANAAAVDQPIAALLTDLKQRDLLKDTLVVCTGEFGRTPHAQGNDGRDHHHQAFTLWMAGGGVKRGMSFGETDPLGYEVVDRPVHIHDLHATMLHLLGLDHEKLTFRHAGRDFRLTDVYGKVMHELIA